MENNKLPEDNAEQFKSSNEPQSAANDAPAEQAKDFPTELAAENNNMDAEKFVKKQEQYKQMLETNAVELEENKYIWRIGFGRRLGAYVIDNIFVGVLLVVIATITGLFDELIGFTTDISSFAGSQQQIMQLTAFINDKLLPLSLAVTFIYYSLEVIFAQSLGKMLLGIVIGDANKRFAGYSKLLLRCIIKNISSVVSLLFLITSLGFIDTLASIFGFIVWIGCFFVLGERRQSLHDSIAKTAVYFKDELQQLDNKNRETNF